jgi:hypothetical protein
MVSQANIRENRRLKCTAQVYCTLLAQYGVKQQLLKCFDAVISFAELDDKVKSQIARTCIEAAARSYKDEKDFKLIKKYSNNLSNAVIRCKSAREIQHLVSDTFALAYIQSIKEQI